MKWMKVLLTGSLLVSLCACGRLDQYKSFGRQTVKPMASLLTQQPMEISKKQLNKHHYTIDVTLDTENHVVSGKMTIEIKNNSDDDWNELYLRDYASIIDVTSQPTQYQQVNDGSHVLTVEVDDHDASIVKVVLAEPLKAGDSMLLYVNYESYLVLNAYGRFNVHVEEYEDRQVGHYTLGNFYPILSYYEDGAWVNHPYYDVGECFYSPVSDYDVTVTAPKDYLVSSTGTMIEETFGDETVTRIFHEEDVRDFAMSIANDYLVLQDEIDGIKVNSYYYDGCQEAAQYALEEAKNGIQLYNRYLGKYPYQEFDIATVPALSGGGMEFPGYVMIIDRYYYNNNQKSLSKVVIHELAHQWFYGLVGNDQYDMPWLDESLASVMELIYQQYYHPDIYEEQVAYFASDKNNIYTDLIVSKAYNEYTDPGSFINCAYTVGQMFMYQVREWMGEEDFINAMKEYVTTYSYLEAKTENLVEILNKHSDDSLEELYQTYLEPEYYTTK